MFRRKWSGLPDDRQFPADLTELGYMVNKDDEVRSIADENYYFKFFLSRNDRVNCRQRFAFNTAVEKEVHKRILALGLEKILLPLGTTDPTAPHVPIFASKDIATKKHVVLVVGEPCQDLGIIALRVMNGKGGVDHGSMVSLIKNLQKKHQGDDNDGSDNEIGIVLANPGQTYWWPEGQRAVSPQGVLGLPLPSAVHYGRAYDASANAAPGNATPQKHVAYVFDEALPKLLHPDARLGVVAMSEGAHLVGAVLGNDEKRWEKWAGKMGAFAILGGCMSVMDLSCAGFKEFLAKRARAYVWSEKPQGTLLAGSQGNPKMRTFTSYGCPVIASGEPALDELILVTAQDHILTWLLGALTAPGYCNPVDVSLPSVADLPADEFSDDEGGDGKDGSTWVMGDGECDWGDVPDGVKPEVLVLKDPVMQEQLEELNAWDELQRTGNFPKPPDSDDEE